MHTHNTKTADQIAKTLIDKTNETEMEWIRLEATDPDYRRLLSMQHNSRPTAIFYGLDTITGAEYFCTGPHKISLYRKGKSGTLTRIPATQECLCWLFGCAENNWAAWIEAQILMARRQQLSDETTVRALFSAVDLTRLAEDTAGELTFRKSQKGANFTEEEAFDYHNTMFRKAKEASRKILATPNNEVDTFLIVDERGLLPIDWRVRNCSQNVANYKTDLHKRICPDYDDCSDANKENIILSAATVILLSIFDD